MSFVHQLRARFFEIDRAGIVFFGRIYEYCHAALEELLIAIYGDIEAYFANTKVGLPLVHSEADYHKPIRIGEDLEVTLRVARLSAKSVTFAYDVRGLPGGALKAKVQLVHAFVDLTSFTSASGPPDGFVDGLRRLALLPDDVE